MQKVPSHLYNIIKKFGECKSDFFDETKQEFFKSVVMLVLLCSHTTWTHMKLLEKK